MYFLLFTQTLHQLNWTPEDYREHTEFKEAPMDSLYRLAFHLSRNQPPPCVGYPIKIVPRLRQGEPFQQNSGFALSVSPRVARPGAPGTINMRMAGCECSPQQKSGAPLKERHSRLPLLVWYKGAYCWELTANVIVVSSG